MMHQLQKVYGYGLGLVIAFVILFVVSIHMGTITIPINGAIDEITRAIGFVNGIGAPLDDNQRAVFWFIRLPRLLVGVLVGSALATAGAVMQGVFANPLADPGVVGVSSGASLGAVIAIALGLTSVSMFYMPLFAFGGAFGAVVLIVGLAMRDNKVHPITLLLSGVAVSLFLGALTSGLLTFMNEYRLREFLFWMVGGLDYRRWEHVVIAIGPIIVGISVLFMLARHLNVLVLGDVEARALGQSVMFYRLLFLSIASVITATAVCVSGFVGFVGLVVPHIMRILVGPDHRSLLPLSALAGAVFLVFCDTLGRVILTPIEIRLGIMTALVGAPYFLFLLRRLRAEGGI